MRTPGIGAKSVRVDSVKRVGEEVEVRLHHRVARRRCCPHCRNTTRATTPDGNVSIAGTSSLVST